MKKWFLVLLGIEILHAFLLPDAASRHKLLGGNNIVLSLAARNRKQRSIWDQGFFQKKSTKPVNEENSALSRYTWNNDAEEVDEIEDDGDIDALQDEEDEEGVEGEFSQDEMNEDDYDDEDVEGEDDIEDEAEEGAEGVEDESNPSDYDSGDENDDDDVSVPIQFMKRPNDGVITDYTPLFKDWDIEEEDLGDYKDMDAQEISDSIILEQQEQDQKLLQENLRRQNLSPHTLLQQQYQQQYQQQSNVDWTNTLPRSILKTIDKVRIQEEEAELERSAGTPAALLPILAVIGRPNTGKSTFVNRLAQCFQGGSITHDEPGITRDRSYHLVQWSSNYSFQVVDTGGILFGKATSTLEEKNSLFNDAIFQQASIAIFEASAIILVCNVHDGIHPKDLEIVRWLRKQRVNPSKINNGGNTTSTSLLCNIPVYLAINKCEGLSFGGSAADGRGQALLQKVDKFRSLGLGKPFPISAIHGFGVSDLIDEICTGKPVLPFASTTEKRPKRKKLKDMEKEEEGQGGKGEGEGEGRENREGDANNTNKPKLGFPIIKKVQPEESINVAILGRPNVGKSSIYNRLAGAYRSIVSNIAGTTRDTVDSVIYRKREQVVEPPSDPRKQGLMTPLPTTFNSTATQLNSSFVSFRIVDTAGIRHNSKVTEQTEYLMTNRAFKAVSRSEVVVLVIDAIDGIVKQDFILAERIKDEGKGCVLVVNKWDLLEKDDKKHDEVIKYVKQVLGVVRWAEVLVVSATTGQRVEKILQCVHRAAFQHSRRINTAILNSIVHDAVSYNPPPVLSGSHSKRRGRIYFAMQVSSSPPTFLFFVNNAKLFNDLYLRFLEKKIRESFGFVGTPIRIKLKSKTIRDASREIAKAKRKQQRTGRR